MDVLLPAYQELDPGPKFTARIQQLSHALAIPEDARTFCLEILKFLGTVALIMIGGLILLMAG